LVALAILFGVNPNLIFKYMEPTITHNVRELAEWTKDVKTPRLKAEQAAAQKAAAEKTAEALPAGGPKNDSAVIGSEKTVRIDVGGERGSVAVLGPALDRVSVR